MNPHKNFESELKCFFHSAKKPQDEAMKSRVKDEVLSVFTESNEVRQPSFFHRLFSPRVSLAGFALASFFVLFNILPGDQSHLSAGQLVPEGGVVEIVRGDQVLLVREEMELQKGDIVRVDNGQAKLVFPDQFTSTIGSDTQLRILEGNSVFLRAGTIENQSFLEGEFSTLRGFVRTNPGSRFVISVSDTGEMQVISQKNKVNVFDWDSGEVVLSEGEKLRLRTDTVLSEQSLPDDISLSGAQLRSIQSKLIIVRAKLLTAVEKILAREKDGSEKDILSARKSFLSIYNVFQSSRDLQIVREIDFEAFTPGDIVRLLSERDVPEHLRSDARAVEALLSLVERNRNSIAFGVTPTEVLSFDRFVMLDLLFSLATPEEVAFEEDLKQKYVVVFLRDVQNRELKIDQVSRLNEEVSKLPRTALARDFLDRLKVLLPPDLMTVLEEKIERDFQAS